MYFETQLMMIIMMMMMMLRARDPQIPASVRSVFGSIKTQNYKETIERFLANLIQIF